MKTHLLLLLLILPFITNAQLTYNNGFALGYLGSDYGSDIACDSAGNIYIIGSYATYLDMDPGAAVSPLNSAGGAETYLAKYTPAG
ncbi:MAG: SBBP repeat-containing protein, partial [Bacteroidota bacterium]